MKTSAVATYQPTGDGVLTPAVHSALTTLGGRYAVYQNLLIGDETFGAVKLLRFGSPDTGFATADNLPYSHPDKNRAGWAYLLVGELDTAKNDVKGLDG